MINNTDLLHPDIDPRLTLDCLKRTNTILERFDGLKQVGTVFLWDKAIKDYDTLFSYHVWTTKDGQIYDSHHALIQGVEQNKAAGMDFGIIPDPDSWKTIQIKLKGDKLPTVKRITKQLRSYRGQKIDCIYVVGWLNIENIQGISSFHQAIVNQQKENFTNKQFLEILKTNTDTI